MAIMEHVWNYLIIWEFRVRAGMEKEFEAAYGSAGRWAIFFKQSAGYIGTQLNRDLDDPQRYVTLDFWTLREAYENFHQRHQAEYRAIDRDCEPLTVSEKKVGAFLRMI
jgi:heme-degrading monooxygenase HmoA